MVRRPRYAPAEPAAHGADVDDRLRSAVGIRRIVLPRRDPLEHGVRHLVHAQDRVLAALALAEGGVDEVAVGANAQPERTEVTEHHLALGRLAEQAHVGDAAVRDQVPGTGRVAAVLRTLRLGVLGLLDLPADGGDQHIAAQAHACVLQRPDGLDVTGERALHVRDPEPVEAPVLHERARLEAGHVLQPRLAAGVRGVHVPVEHQRLPAARPAPGAEGVRAAFLDLLPLHLQPHLLVQRDHQLGHALLVAGEAVHVDQRARSVDQAGSC